MQAKLIKREPAALDTESFYFEPSEPVNFRPGQYLRLRLPHEPADDRGELRFFSVSSSPDRPYLMITTKFSDPSSSFKRALRDLPLGSKLDLWSPKGDFVLPDNNTAPLVLVAGGIGITPFHSMLTYVAEHNLPYQIQVIYAARTPAYIAYRSEFDQIAAAHPKLRFTYIVEQPEDGWQNEVGRLDGEKIKQLGGGLDGKLVYLSGPEPMVQALEGSLKGIGADMTQVRTDYFPGYTQF